MTSSRGFFKAFLSDTSRPTSRYAKVPVWDGSVPHLLPRVDAFDARLGIHQNGWHTRDSAVEALRQCGIWSDGLPSRLFQLELPCGVPVIGERADCRHLMRYNAPQWWVLREISVDSCVEAVARYLVGHDGATRIAEALTRCLEQVRGGFSLRSEPHAEPELRRLCPDIFDAAWDFFDSRLTEVEIDATGRSDIICGSRDTMFCALLDDDRIRAGHYAPTGEGGE